MFSTFAQQVAFRIVLRYLPNSNKVLIFGLNLTEKLWVTIHHLIYKDQSDMAVDGGGEA